MVSCTATLTRGLKDIGDSIVIGSSQGTGILQLQECCENLEIIPFEKKTPVWLIKNCNTLKRIIKENKIDVIHAQNRIPALYAAWYCFFHRDVKYIWANHLVPLQYDLKSRMMTRYGSAAVAEGIEGKEMLESIFGIPESKVSVINLGTDISHFTKTSQEEQSILRQRLKIKNEEKVILLYGRLTPVKGHLFLLEALENLADKEFVLIFPGENDAYKRTILEKAKQIGIQNKIRFPGYIDGRSYLSIADLMILPSRKEGFGIVNVESFCMGVPVIRTKTAGYRDMEDCCFGIDYGDVNGLYSLLTDFFSDDLAFIKKATYAKGQVKRFTLENMSTKYHELYTQVYAESDAKCV